MLCFRKMSVTKKFMNEWGISRPSIESLMSHSTGKLRGGAPNETVVPGCENVVLKRVVSRFSVEQFLSHSTDKLRRGNLMCCVSENCRSRKISWNRGGYQGFLLKVCCLTVQEKFVREYLMKQ